MLRKQKKILIFVLTLALILAPILVFGQEQVKTSTVQIPDPINAENLMVLFARLIKGLLGIVGAFALLNFALAGFGIIYARGNEEKISKHKENIKWTLLGILFLFGSYAIIAFFIERMADTSGFSGG